MKQVKFSASIVGICTILMQSACSNIEPEMNADSSEAETYIVSSNNNCKINNPAPQANETVTWSGNCKDGYADGDGITTWYVDGKLFEIDTGYNIKGKLNGSVTMDVKDNFIYKGEVAEDIFQGFGVITWENGSSYNGNWENDQWNGYGMLTAVPTDKSYITQFKSANQGKYVGKNYVVEGIFEAGYLMIECQKSDCPAQ